MPGDFLDTPLPRGEFTLERCHGHISNATGDDGIESVEIATYIQSEAMHGDPAADTHTDRSQFAVSHPHASQAVASGGRQPEISTKMDETVLNGS